MKPAPGEPAEPLALLAATAGGAASPTGDAEAARTPLLFLRIGARWFAVAARAVREVVMKSHVTRVPTAPRHVLGVALVRGRLVPVIAFEGLFGSLGTGETAPTLPRLVVLREGDLELAVVADETRGIVLHDSRASMERVPGGEERSYVSGEIEWEGRLVCVLDAGALIEAAAGEPEPRA